MYRLDPPYRAPPMGGDGRRVVAADVAAAGAGVGLVELFVASTTSASASSPAVTFFDFCFSVDDCFLDRGLLCFVEGPEEADGAEEPLTRLAQDTGPAGFFVSNPTTVSGGAAAAAGADVDAALGFARLESSTGGGGSWGGGGETIFSSALESIGFKGTAMGLIGLGFESGGCFADNGAAVDVDADPEEADFCLDVCSV